PASRFGRTLVCERSLTRCRPEVANRKHYMHVPHQKSPAAAGSSCACRPGDMLRSAGSSQLDCSPSAADRNIDMQSLHSWRIHSCHTMLDGKMPDWDRSRYAACIEFIAASVPNERTSEVAQAMHLAS